MPKSKAEKAGISLADSIFQTCQLFYNERAKRSFCKGLIERLEERLEVNV